MSVKSGNLLRPIYFTPIGGLAVWLINDTGAPSVKGVLVNTETSVDLAFDIVGADEPDIIGAIYDDAVPDGDPCRIVFAGIAEVLLVNATISTRGYWARISDTVAGRADITNAAPGGGTINAIDGHFREIGHCLESITAGTDKLAKILMHFN